MYGTSKPVQLLIRKEGIHMSNFVDVAISVFKNGRRLASTILTLENGQSLVGIRVGGMEFSADFFANKVLVKTTGSSVCLDSVNMESGRTCDPANYDWSLEYTVGIFQQ